MKRRKLIITSIVLTLSMGVIPAFAVSDAGIQLQKWYDSRFNAATESINDSVVSPGLGRMNSQLSELTNKLIESSKKAIKDAESNTLLYSIGPIYDYMSNYIDSINSKKKELIGDNGGKGTISKDFDSFVKDKNEEVDKAADNAVQEFLNGLNEDLNDKADDSKKAMEQRASDAQSELSQAITASKQKISNKLAAEEGTAESEIKAHINLKVDESKKAVEDSTKDLVHSKISSINQKGLELESEALQEMSSLISQI